MVPPEKPEMKEIPVQLAANVCPISGVSITPEILETVKITTEKMEMPEIVEMMKAKASWNVCIIAGISGVKLPIRE